MYKNNIVSDDISLFKGISGDVILYYELYQFYGDVKYKRLLNRSIRLLLKKFKHGRNLSFGNGYTGVLYVLSYLINSKYIKKSFTIFDDLESTLNCYAVQLCQNCNYDLQNGLIGLGIYYIEWARMDVTKQKYVISTIEMLIELAGQYDNDSLYWSHHEDSKAKRPSTIVDLGFLHGMTSVLSFFLICIKEGYLKSELRLVLEKGLNCFMRFEQQIKNKIYNFPNYIILHGKNVIVNNPESRIGFCYGDLGIIYLFYKAFEYTGNDKYFQIAEKSSKKIYLRLYNNSETSDPYFCHGSSGIIYFINQFALYSDWWAKRKEILMSLFLPEFYKSTCYHLDSNKHGMLSGINGIILSALLQEKNNCLERILLLN